MDSGVIQTVLIDGLAEDLIAKIERVAQDLDDEPGVACFAQAARAAIRCAQVKASKRALGLSYMQSPLALYDESSASRSVPTHWMVGMSVLVGVVVARFTPVDLWVAEWLAGFLRAALG